MSQIIMNVGHSMASIWLVKYKEYTCTCHVQYCKLKKKLKDNNIYGSYCNTFNISHVYTVT